MRKIFIIIIAIVIILIASGVILMLSYKIFAKKSPTEAYLDICKEFDGAKNYNEAYVLFKKYTTQAYQDRLVQQRGELPVSFTDNSEETDRWFQFLKSTIMGAPLNRLQINKEETKGNVAELYLGDKNSSVASGRATLKLENGNWKIDDESWVYDYVVPAQ